MNWYAAHLILYVKLHSAQQARFPVWESVVLIKAASEAEAFAQAERRGQEDAGDDDGSFRWGDEPACWVFAGVRKLALCQDAQKRPGDGTEVTCTEMEVRSLEVIDALVAGKPAPVRIADRFRAAPATPRSHRSAEPTAHGKEVDRSLVERE